MSLSRVLVVEDDAGLRDVLVRGLGRAGFDVVAAPDGSSALRIAQPGQVDGVVLDVGLPDADGRDVCIALRSRGIDVPVLFLTARGNVTDRLSGFAVGGDDYLSKPFAFSELVARLTALLRRAVDDSLAAGGDMQLDPVTHELTCRGTTMPISPTEFRLLASLLSAPGAVVRRKALIAAGWPHGAIVADNTLDQYISKLRKKLVDAGSTHQIESSRGVGYRLY